jgi:hypothetical protein
MIARLQRDLAVLELADADFRALQIDQHADGAAARLGEGTHQFAALLMFFRRAVREIETDNVHPAFNHLVQNFRVRTRRTQSGDNFCSTQHGLS